MSQFGLAHCKTSVPHVANSNADLSIFFFSEDFLNSFLVPITVYPYCDSPPSVVLHILSEVQEVKTTFTLILRCYLSCLVPSHFLMSLQGSFLKATWHILQKIECRSRYKNPAISVKPDIKKSLHNVKQCCSSHNVFLFGNI